MPRRNNISELVAAEVAFRDEEGPLHDDEPMRGHEERSKKRKKEEEAPPSPKVNYQARLDDLLEKLSEQDKKLQAFIAAEADKEKKNAERRGQKAQEREAKKAQRAKEKGDFWTKKQAEIQALVQQGVGHNLRQVEEKTSKALDTIRWRPFAY